MTRFLFIVLIVTSMSHAASAADVYVSNRVNLRAGPDGGYPAIVILQRDERLDLSGCVRDYTWCEVQTRSGERGWVYAQYLRFSDGRNTTVIQSNGNGTRVIIFRPNDYWDRYYRDKYFYNDRYRWIPRGSYHHDDDGWNDDDNNDHGHHGGRPPVVEKPAEPPKYQGIKPPGNSQYNPLCPMGRRDC